MIIFDILFGAIFVNGNNISFIPFSEGNTLTRRAFLKTISNGTKIESPHIFSMWILMLSCLWDLFQSKFGIILATSLAENITVDKRLSAL